MRKGGIVTARRRQRERGKRIRRCAMTTGLVLLLCALAMSGQLRERLGELMEGGIAAVGAFSEAKTESIELTLDEKEIYALQLGVYDSEERALSEQQRLMSQGVPCVIWQRDKMRLICSAGKSRESLDMTAAGGNEAYVVRDTLQQVRLRLSCAEGEGKKAAAFVSLPDELLDELLSGGTRTLDECLSQTRWLAAKALDAHPENALYTELARALLDWCSAVDAEAEQPYAACYAAVTLCTLCREWRGLLLNDHLLRTESTASAQRTPSTAAEVMPPA